MTCFAVGLRWLGPYRVDGSVRNNRPTQVETTTTQVETTHHPVRNPPPTELETRSPQSETWATSRNLTRPKCKRKGPFVIKGSSALKTSSWVSIFKWRRQGTGQPGRTLRKNGGDSGQTDIGFTSSWLRVGRRQWSNRRWFENPMIYLEVLGDKVTFQCFQKTGK